MPRDVAPSAAIARCRAALGTFVEIAIEPDARIDAGAAIDAAFAAIARVERLMSFHDPASELSAINRDAHARPLRVDPWTFDVLAAARELFLRSDGRFDCTVASLLVERGVLPPIGGIVDPDADFGDVLLDHEQRTVRFRVPLIVDLGGIAKGFAVDRAIDALVAHGVTGGVVNAGGDLRVLGSRALPIHVRGFDGRLAYAGDLADGACATSIGGPAVAGPSRAPAALIDANAGRFVDAARAFTVVAPTCLVADALTKVVATGGTDVDALLASFGAVASIR